MPDASLIVGGTAGLGGTEFLGWTQVSVTRSAEQLAHTWDLSYVEHWTNRAEPLPIFEGQPCAVKLGAQAVTAGYIDEVEIDYDATTHSLRANGRSKTGDLVDCSAVYGQGKGQWRGRSLLQFARDLCDPFGISVRAVGVVDETSAPFRRFAVQDGETVHEALERACRTRGVILMTDPTGNLMITRAGAQRTATTLQLGGPTGNIVRGGRTGSWRERFSPYIIKSQVAGDAQLSGLLAAQPKRTSTDPQIDRYRPLVVHAECQETGTQLQKRADFETNVRAGRSQRLRYTVKGWENAEGLWQPNVMCHVTDPKLKVDTDLLIVTVRQSKGPNGTETELELTAREALSVEPWIHRPQQGLSWL